MSPLPEITATDAGDSWEWVGTGGHKHRRPKSELNLPASIHEVHHRRAWLPKDRDIDTWITLLPPGGGGPST